MPSRARVSTSSARVAAVVAVVATTTLLAEPRARADELRACAAASERAQSRRLEGKLVAAHAELVACTRPACPAVVRADCEQWLSEVSASLPSIVVSARDDAGHDLVDVRLKIDGVVAQDPLTGKAASVDPGVHELRYEHEGSTPVVEKVLVREGEKNRLLTAVFGNHVARSPAPSPAASAAPAPRDELPAPPASTRSRVVPMIVGGVGVVALASFAYFGLTASSRYRELRDGCGATRACTESALDAVRTRAVAADVSLGVGIAAVATAGVLFFLVRSPPASPSHGPGAARTALVLSPSVGAGGGALRLSGTF